MKKVSPGKMTFLLCFHFCVILAIKLIFTRQQSSTRHPAMHAAILSAMNRLPGRCYILKHKKVFFVHSYPVAVTGHFKTSQPGSNQNRPI
jgi:hypothetical protein